MGKAKRPTTMDFERVKINMPFVYCCLIYIKVSKTMAIPVDPMMKPSEKRRFKMKDQVEGFKKLEYKGTNGSYAKFA